MKFEALKLY